MAFLRQPALDLMDDTINLVNEKGERIGFMGKLEAHAQGKLHEAFSIFVFNTRNETLLQKRAAGKYHSGGLWTNTCCSHAHVGEKLEAAAHRRLKEEMGFDCDLKEVDAFIYRADEVGNGLIEHEFDHVFVGFADKVQIILDPQEVSECKWMSLEDLKDDAVKDPAAYTAWLKIILGRDILSSQMIR